MIAWDDIITIYVVFAVMLTGAVAGMIWFLLHLRIFEAVKLGVAQDVKARGLPLALSTIYWDPLPAWYRDCLLYTSEAETVGNASANLSIE